jgi:phage N-6-adenine-methyltransferase
MSFAKDQRLQMDSWLSLTFQIMSWNAGLFHTSNLSGLSVTRICNASAAQAGKNRLASCKPWAFAAFQMRVSDSREVKRGSCVSAFQVSPPLERGELKRDLKRNGVTTFCRRPSLASPAKPRRKEIADGRRDGRRDGALTTAPAASGFGGEATMDIAEGRTLTRYEAARFALAEARRVDEVKEIIDMSAALREYARRAKDTQLIRDATELRLHAERKGGELLRQMAAKGERAVRGQAQKSHGETFQPVQLAELKITKTQSSKWQRLAALSDDKFEIRVAHAKARVEGMTTSAPSYSNAEYAGEDDEWFTPPEIIELAREALGGIDLDPATHTIAQQTIGAATFYTAADNGLARPWFGRVWLNPPFNRTLLSLFVDKLISEYSSGAVEQAILLTHDYTDVEWFHAAARAARMVCFTSGRIRFLAPCGDVCSPRQGQALFYFGADDAAFGATFAEVGLIVRAL